MKITDIKVHFIDTGLEYNMALYGKYTSEAGVVRVFTDEGIEGARGFREPPTVSGLPLVSRPSCDVSGGARRSHCPVWLNLQQPSVVSVWLLLASDRCSLNALPQGAEVCSSRSIRVLDHSFSFDLGRCHRRVISDATQHRDAQRLGFSCDLSRGFWVKIGLVDTDCCLDAELSAKLSHAA